QDAYPIEVQQRIKKLKAFKRWVTSEVLPSIRKHGAYITQPKIEEILANPDIIIELATTLKKERAERQKVEAKLEEAKPKMLFADAVVASDTTILIGELAKIIKQNGYDIGQKRMFSWLRQNGYLINRKGTDWNSPTQRSMEMGLFKIHETVIYHNNGEVDVKRTTKVTGKGQTYFVNKFLGEKHA
ncbi:MAG: phage antirepressor KilAC domain-containing protein, partial [Phascolarctobacterium sp.]|nr:phage antirepressor KilAC domain-containing protein [Phascolarctobacterium sp.]